MPWCNRRGSGVSSGPGTSQSGDLQQQQQQQHQQCTGDFGGRTGGILHHDQTVTGTQPKTFEACLFMATACALPGLGNAYAWCSKWIRLGCAQMRIRYLTALRIVLQLPAEKESMPLRRAFQGFAFLVLSGEPAVSLCQI